jgi:hypothetical protein
MRNRANAQATEKSGREICHGLGDAGFAGTAEPAMARKDCTSTVAN